MSYLKSKDGSIEASIKEMSKHLNDSAYQQMFKKELEKTGKGLASMSDQEKKDFFNKIDKKYKKENAPSTADLDRLKKMGMKKEDLDKKDEPTVKKIITKLKGASQAHAGQAKDLEKAMKTEKVDNPYAVGMAAAMKAKDDKPPLKKSTITKAHDIAKSIKKDQNETHSFVTNKMNQSQKDAKGEKEVLTKEADEKGNEINKHKLDMLKQGEKKVVDPKPKMNFKEMYKNMSPSQKKMKEAEENEKKKKTDTGEKPTEIDLKPQIKYSR